MPPSKGGYVLLKGETVLKKALIVWGGWEGHQSEAVSNILADMLRSEKFEVTLSNTLDSFSDISLMQSMDLIIPNWTNGKIAKQPLSNLIETIQNGCGLAGCHAGMCGAFRQEVDYHYMTGGQWVQHPGGDGICYTVRITDQNHPVTKGMTDFEVFTEQYYMHIDPAISIHAVTNFDKVEMPVVWTKKWGKGNVYYNSLGHSPEIIQQPAVYKLLKKGFLWASR